MKVYELDVNFKKHGF